MTTSYFWGREGNSHPYDRVGFSYGDLSIFAKRVERVAMSKIPKK